MEIVIRKDDNEYRKIRTVYLTEEDGHIFASFTVTARKEFPSTVFSEPMINWSSIGEQNQLNTLWFVQGMKHCLTIATQLQMEFTGKEA